VSPASAWTLVRGALVGLALFAWLAHVQLAVGGTVSSLLLPVCGVAGIGIAAGWSPQRAAATAARAPRWLSAITILLVAAITGVLAWGALATGDRDWDGIVAWGLKANALAAQATLAQPLFADPEVYHHSPDYPLLQPLAVASIGRAWFPLVYALLTALVGFAVRRRTGDGALACAIALAVALTPDLIGTGGGSVDSGYADAAHALALAAAAAALLLDDALLLGAAALLLPFVKPEGTVHALALAAAALACARPRLGVAAVLGAAAALALWLPLQLRLAHAPPAGPAVPLGVAAAAILAVGTRLWLRGRAFAKHTRWLAVGAAAATGVVLLVCAQPLFAASHTVLFAHYLGALDRAAAKLAATPAIVLGLLAAAFTPRRGGALFALLVLLAAARLRRGARPADSGAPPGLVAFLLLLLLAVLGAFYLSPETDVDHHLRSSAPRLLLQLCGAGWLCAAAALPQHLAALPRPRWLAGPPARAQ
jgi:hypothetical protein